MIEKLSKYYKQDILYADRGYDSENIFKICFKKLKAYPLILQRRLDVPKHRRKGTYRKLCITNHKNHKGFTIAVFIRCLGIVN